MTKSLCNNYIIVHSAAIPSPCRSWDAQSAAISQNLIKCNLLVSIYAFYSTKLCVACQSLLLQRRLLFVLCILILNVRVVNLYWICLCTNFKQNGQEFNLFCESIVVTLSLHESILWRHWFLIFCPSRRRHKPTTTPAVSVAHVQFKKSSWTQESQAVSPPWGRMEQELKGFLV